VRSTLLEIGLVVLFILVGSVFAAAEIALVSLRESQVRNLAAARGRRGQIVQRLHADPNRFLASVQVGVTLAGFLSAAFGGATLAGKLAPVLAGWGLPTGAATPVALVAITLAISYLSLVLGELTPKRLALQRGEGIALFMAPALDKLARWFRPVIWLLSVSTNGVVRLLGGDPRAQRQQITDEELRELVSGHEALGEEERRIVEDVFEAGDRQIREVMVPRTEVDFIDASTPVFRAAKLALEQPHSRYPVIRGSADEVIGFVHVRDLLGPEVSGRSLRVGQLAREALTLPWTRPILAALADMRREGVHLAIVADEYGGTAGIVALEDLVEELVGDIRDEYDAEEQETTRRGDEIEVDGLLNLDDFEDETGLPLPDGPYETVAGYIAAQLGHVPDVGEAVFIGEHRLVVTALDGRRVARVLVTGATAPAAPTAGTGTEELLAEHALASPVPPRQAAEPAEASPSQAADRAEARAAPAPQTAEAPTDPAPQTAEAPAHPAAEAAQVPAAGTAGAAGDAAGARHESTRRS
jgi:magnesium and cobalt exporter, CNNM family